MGVYIASRILRQEIRIRKMGGKRMKTNPPGLRDDEHRPFLTKAKD
jgi:hypothetical protein